MPTSSERKFKCLVALEGSQSFKTAVDAGFIPLEESYRILGVLAQHSHENVLAWTITTLKRTLDECLDGFGMMTKAELFKGLDEVHEGPWTQCPICKKPMNRKGHPDCKITDVFDTDGFTAHELANILLQMPDTVVATDEGDIIRVVAFEQSIYVSIFTKEKGNIG